MTRALDDADRMQMCAGFDDVLVPPRLYFTRELESPNPSKVLGDNRVIGMCLQSVDI